MQRVIYGPCADALASLTPTQIEFLKSLPKAELHAHLNGCIPLACLQELAKHYTETHDQNTLQSDYLKKAIDRLQHGVELSAIGDFFGLFPAIYTLTSTPKTLAHAARAVLNDFLDGEQKQCTYIELRSTPRKTESMTRLQYVETVLDEVEKYPEDVAALIVSLDRRMSRSDARECVDIAVQLKKAGRRVVGVDLCGDPTAGNMQDFAEYFHKAKAAGLGVTLHIAETEQNTSADTTQLLSFKPDRLGHATFLDENAKNIVFNQGISIEICLSSNILCKTVKSLQDHHILYHFNLNHPVILCTDDTLPFRNSLLGEYALALAKAPLGLGMSEDCVRRLAKMGMDSRFRTQTEFN